MARIGHDIELAAELLRKGEVIGLPTETVYGLAGNALSEEAVIRIFAVKQRPYFDPLIVHVSGTESLAQWSTHVSDLMSDLTTAFWPGPLTILLPRKAAIPDLVTSGLDRAGFRCPDHPMALELLRTVEFPLAAPSANPFGYVSPTTAEHVNRQLGEKIPYIVDGGPCRVGLESTIIGMEDEQLVVYRLGGLTLEEIERVTGRGKGRPQLRVHASTSNPASPGQLLSHYAPLKKMVLGDPEELAEQVRTSKQRFAVLSFGERPVISGCEHMLALTRSGSTEEAARNLFRCLRELDQLPIDIILAEPAPSTGLGPAINDRLKRASS